MQIKLTKITDINEKELLYIQLTNKAGTKVNINIGEKSWNKITALIAEEDKTNSEGNTPTKPTK